MHGHHMQQAKPVPTTCPSTTTTKHKPPPPKWQGPPWLPASPAAPSPLPPWPAASAPHHTVNALPAGSTVALRLNMPHHFPNLPQTKHLLGTLCFVVLVQLLIYPVMVGHPSHLVQPVLADLLTAQGQATCGGRPHRRQAVRLAAAAAAGRARQAGNGEAGEGSGRRLCAGRAAAHTVMSMSGSWLMLSAASNPFSTSSRMVVYRHLPGCRRNRAVQRQQAWMEGRRHGHSALPHASGSPKLAAHIVESRDGAVVGEELGRTLLLQHVGLALAHHPASLPPGPLTAGLRHAPPPP